MLNHEQGRDLVRACLFPERGLKMAPSATTSVVALPSTVALRPVNRVSPRKAAPGKKKS